MYFNDWNTLYKKIAKDLKINIDEDKKASKIFNQMLKVRKNHNNIKNLKELIYDNEIIVFGAGPSLKNSIIKYKKFIENKIKITADGATSALIEFNIIPDIIVTDLDGRIKDQIYANSKGAITIIHVHSDNLLKIKNNLEKFKGEIIGSTQINNNEFSLLNNFGGFTDGDRGIILSLFFKAKIIYLIGFDFNGTIGEYSFPKFKNKKLKLLKLKWCKKIIDSIEEKDKIKYL